MALFLFHAHLNSVREDLKCAIYLCTFSSVHARECVSQSFSRVSDPYEWLVPGCLLGLEVVIILFAVKVFVRLWVGKGQGSLYMH